MLLSLVLTLVAVAAQAEPTETTVTVPTPGGDVVGTLSLAAGEPAPVVLLLHGFTGSRDELKTDFVPEGVFAHTARKLADAGFSSLRIDFRGSGESLADLTFADTTYEGQVADGLAAVAYLESLPEVDGNRLYVIGWSQGGLVATAVAGRSDAPDAVALWNAVADPEETFGTLFGPEALATAVAATAGEEIVTKLPWGAEVTLKGSYFDEVATFDPVAEIKDYAGPVLIVQGTADTVVVPAQGDAFAAALHETGTLWTAPMDHVFNTFAGSDLLDQMIGETVAFFETHEG
jgi:dipeptidyl aminopeptidase/acylaminoacyl peptidase